MSDQKEQPITITFPSGKTMQKVVDFIVRKKPVNWSRRSYATYYNENYANWIKKDIDEMLKDRQPLIYRYDMFKKLKPSSLYLRINQAIRFLLDELDPDGIYAKWVREVSITRISGVGVSLAFDEFIEGDVRAEKYKGDEDLPYWRKRIDEYLEAEKVSGPLHLTKLLLSPDQIAQLEAELQGINDFAIYSINSKEIKIVRNDA